LGSLHPSELALTYDLVRQSAIGIVKGRQPGVRSRDTLTMVLSKNKMRAMGNSVAGSGNAEGRRTTFRWLLCLSLLLNVALAIWLLCHPSNSIAPETTKASTILSDFIAPSPPTGSVASEKRPGRSIRSFDWREIESADYRQYIANLRAVGCPEQTIRDIILADLNQVFAERAQAILPTPSTRDFWQKPAPRQRPDSNQVSQLRDLHEQKQSAIKQLLGIRLEGQESLNTLWIQPDSARTSLAFLPEEKRQAAYRALCETDLAYVSLREAGQTNQGRQAAVLSTILSSDELEEFRMRTNPEASFLRGELQYFDSTPEEFRTLLKLRETARTNTNTSSYPYVRMAQEAEAFGQVFGVARAQEYARKADPFYCWASRAAERYGLAEDAPARAWEVKSQAITIVHQLHADAALTVEERRHLLQDLHQSTEAKLLGILGSKGLTMAKLGDWWLQNPLVDISQ
jgi:hypothetical protein